MSALTSLAHATYLLHQRAYATWAKRKYRHHFDDVDRFVLFVGYPRSGHSLVGALLNAHRDAVLSHELNAPDLVLAGCTRDELYGRILARAAWFNLRGNASNHAYSVPGQWKGRFESLRAIGDKRGGAVTRTIARHPEFLGRVRDLVGIPLRLIHVVRNPFDNIAAISIWHALTLGESVDYYFSHWRTTATLSELGGTDEVVTLRHEDLLVRSDDVLAGLCAALGLAVYPGYLDDCRRVLFETPTYTRREVAWTPALVADVERRARDYPLLYGYGFETPEALATRP